MSYWSGKPDVGRGPRGLAAMALQLAYGVTRGQQRFIEYAMYMHDLPSRRAGSYRREPNHDRCRSQCQRRRRPSPSVILLARLADTLATSRTLGVPSLR